MKQKIYITLFFLLTYFLFSQNLEKIIYDLTGVKTAKEIINLIERDILPWINNEVIINEVNKRNFEARNRTLAEIKELDEKWIKSKDIEDWMKSYFDNPASKFLLEKEKEFQGLIKEIFVMDYQGCNVALTDKTSDFWQGDEDKFNKSYGEKRIFIDRISFDLSTRTNSKQISLPLYDRNQKKNSWCYYYYSRYGKKRIV